MGCTNPAVFFLAPILGFPVCASKQRHQGLQARPSEMQTYIRPCDHPSILGITGAYQSTHVFLMCVVTPSDGDEVWLECGV